MRRIITWAVGLAMLIAGIAFSWFILAIALSFIVLMVTILLLRRLWFKLSGRQPTPFFVFRQQRYHASQSTHQRDSEYAQGRTIDATAEQPENDEQTPRIQR